MYSICLSIRRFFFYQFIIFIFFVPCLFSQLSGLVFRDYNGNGLRDSSATNFESGVSEFKVLIYNQNGILDSVYTNSQGYFNYMNVSNQALRLEFKSADEMDYHGSILNSGLGSGGNVQFVSSFPQFVLYGLFYPGDYCLDPELVSPCYVSGDPLIPGSSTENYDDYIRMKFSSGGQGFSNIVPVSQGGAAPNFEIIAKAKDLGSCWGVAYQRKTNTLFTTATLKRHIGIGPLGYGGLYIIDLNNQTPSSFIDLNTIGVPSGEFLNNSERGLPTFFPPLSADSLAYSYIGKIGYGGIDFNEDHTELYIVSLYTKKLYKIHLGNPYSIPTTADVDSFSIPDPNCNNGEFRPWALKYYKGKFYIGVTCDGSGANSTFADLTANVYSFDPKSKNFSNILSFDFNYPFNNLRPAFYPWLDNWDPNCEGLPGIYCTHPQAILSDIEFDGPDNMVLGIKDRYGFQGGTLQYDLTGKGKFSILTSGDVLRASLDRSIGQFKLENNAKAGNQQTAGANTGYGPGGGEYYHGDFSANKQGFIVEFETSNGAVAVCPGRNQTATTASDPIDFNSSGIIFLNNTSGNWERRYQIIDPNFATFLGKSTSLGDLKLINQKVSLEIGNYVWNDLNKNGVQDPIEPPLGNVEVQLLKDNVVIATAITNKNGEYIFSNASQPSALLPDPAMVYGISELLPNTSYIVRIPNYSFQVSLNTFIPSPLNSSMDQRDSDGGLNGNHLEAMITTGSEGQNNPDIDFGFYTNNSCQVSLSKLFVSPCNPISNTFNLSFNLEYANTPIGPIVVELNTGQKKIIQSNNEGLNQISFNYIPSEGIKNISVKVFYVFDTNCIKTFLNVFNQPTSCCEGILSLCSNRPNQILLNAIPDMRTYTWYDSTTRTPIGFNSSIIIDNKSPGMEDGYESYYFESIDSSGIQIKQQCLYRVQTIDCCNLKISNFISLGCDNNGTVNNISDDWFSVLVNASNPDAGVSNQYEVIHNGITLATKPYNSAVVIGNSSIPPFKADGQSTYLIMLRDIDSPNCYDTIRTSSRNCPKPNIILDKTIESINIQSDASYNVLYKIHISNIGNEIGTYSLDDEPGLDEDLLITNAFYTTTIPGKQGAALTSSGPWKLISNQIIAPGQSHDIFINLNLEFDDSVGSTGDNIYNSCGSFNGAPRRGEGLFNRALMDTNSDSAIDKIDTTCDNLPLFELTKTIHRQRQLNLKTHELIYLINVKNKGGSTGNYSLNERPGFEDDFILRQANYSSNTGANGILPTTIPLNGWKLQVNKSLAPGAIDSFFVLLQIETDFNPTSQGNNKYSNCGFANPLIPRAGEGLFNVALIDLNNDGFPELRDTACGDLASVEHTKKFIHSKALSSDQFEIEYEIIITNKGGAIGNYDLFDLPGFDQDVLIQSFSYSYNSGPATFPISFNPLRGYLLANDRSINAFDSDTFKLLFKVSLAFSDGNIGNNVYDPCIEITKGNYVSGNGMFNTSSIDLNNDGLNDQVDTSCGDLIFYDLALRKICLQTTPVKFKTNVVFRNTLYNQGLAKAYNIEVIDNLPRIFKFDPILNPNWTKLANNSFKFKLDSLSTQDSISFDLIVLVDSQYHNINELINQAEIFNFTDRSGNKVLDIDSSPDIDPLNDGLVIPNSEDDNNINGHRLTNPTDDEDDHDIAIIPVFDLALLKTINTKGPFSDGQSINFEIKVINQGSLTASRFTIIDYLPEGYSYNANNNPGWLLQNNEITFLYDQNLDSGDSVTIPLQLQLIGGKNYTDYINLAELASANVVQLHLTNVPATDWDSTPDKIKDNDEGGKVNSASDDHILDDALDSDQDGIQDEDDHDPAILIFWDLALKKVLYTAPPHTPNTLLDFGITLFNQGTDTVGSITVRDYIPEGYTFNANNNIGWILNGNYADYTHNKIISPGDSSKIHLFLTLKEGLKPSLAYINYAEIINSKNSKGEDQSKADIDSNEGSNSASENNIKPNSQYDNDINHSDKMGDQDDHDPATAMIMDLALMKTNMPNQFVKYEDTINYSIEIYNQGYIRTDQFSIIDYIPTGLLWVPNPGWTFNSATRSATQTIKTILLPGQSYQTTIKLKFNYPLPLNPDLTNRAEIYSANDSIGNIYTKDIDSNFDIDRFNDPGGIPNSASDNNIHDDGFDTDGDGITDEDDSDPAMIDLVDFALRKEIDISKKSSVNDTAEFIITIVNQGVISSSQISVADYLTSAYQFLPAINPDWNLSGNQLIGTFNQILNPGDSLQKRLKLLILQDPIAKNYYNYAEIYSIKDANNQEISKKDADSNPNSDSNYERNVVPNSNFDNLISGRGARYNEDEDDHDVAGIPSRSKLGDMVWHDKNGNGIMDKGESGISNVLIQLFDYNTRKLLKSTKTNNQGKYLFEDLSGGKYYIKVISPDGYSYTLANISLDTLDSDISQLFGFGTSDLITLQDGTTDLSWDIGLYQCAIIDGFVFYDHNHDGIQQVIDNGINGIYVYLYSYPDNKLINKILTYSTRTSSIFHDGYYRFCVAPGNYYIKVEELYNFEASPFQQGSDPKYNSDINNQNGPFTTYTINLLSGDAVLDINGGIYNKKLLLGRSSNLHSDWVENNQIGTLSGMIINDHVQLNFNSESPTCNSLLYLYRKNIDENQLDLIEIRKINNELSKTNCEEFFHDPIIQSHSNTYEYYILTLSLDGKYYRSNIVKINQKPIQELIIYPNPADHELTIEWTSESYDEPIGLEIRNLEGRLMTSLTLLHKNQYVLDCSSYSAGTYQLVFKSKINTISRLLKILH